jgi:hypothetical protein
MLMVLEIPHQQNNEENDCKHADPEVVTGGIRTAP